jgi:hypothetical protein
VVPGGCPVPGIERRWFDTRPTANLIELRGLAPVGDVQKN